MFYFGIVFSDEKKNCNMKMKIFSLLALMLFAQFAKAQETEFKDLLSLFVDQKYEKVLNKAENYTVNEETKKHPLPYLYISMSLYEMSKIEKYAQMEEYKNAFKDAMKYTSKYAAKDKENDSKSSIATNFHDFFILVIPPLIFI